MSKQDNGNRKITLTLDERTLDTLGALVREAGYGSISAAIRVMVTKHGKRELREVREQ